MKSISKKTKTKSITIRLFEDAYDFIAKKAADQKITKSNYLLSQLDENSEFMLFIEQETGLLELELKRLKEEMKEEDAQWKQYWKSADDEDLKNALSIIKDQEMDKINKVILSEAKKRGLA